MRSDRIRTFVDTYMSVFIKYSATISTRLTVADNCWLSTRLKPGRYGTREWMSRLSWPASWLRVEVMPESLLQYNIWPVWYCISSLLSHKFKGKWQERWGKECGYCLTSTPNVTAHHMDQSPLSSWTLPQSKTRYNMFYHTGLCYINLPTVLTWITVRPPVEGASRLRTRWHTQR